MKLDDGMNYGWTPGDQIGPSNFKYTIYMA